MTFLINEWRTLVQILFLAVAIYYGLMFVRSTRGWPVVIGFGGVVMLTVATQYLGLDLLNYLLRTFFAFGGVALLIIFQPEVRRLLGQLGTRQLFNTVQQERDYIEVVIETVERLSDVRIGALLALQRSNNLEDAVGSGVRVDSIATPEMLETIFFPNNAIHDGGVIIHNGRIIRAACIFPLTQRQDLQKSMGTRHRAALGLSEETDAVVVAVSEETGAISYAYHGELKRGISVEELRSFLTDVIIVEAKGNPFASLFRPHPALTPPEATPPSTSPTGETSTTS